MNSLKQALKEWDPEPKQETFSPIKIMNFRGWETLVSKELGVYPFFSSEIRWRVTHKLFTNVAVVGEPGIGKSYDALDMARICEGLTRKGKDRFKIRQCVFRQSEYLSLLPGLRMGKPIVFDEPSYALGKRDWYKELQKVLVHTIESQRFLVHPLFIPIVNLALLDKVIRDYLISHVVHVVGRGHGIVYRIKPSQRVTKVYWYQRGELYYRMFDIDDCSKDSCLGCKKLGDPDTSKADDCQIFRAKYERKKRMIQIDRYEQGKTQALQKESMDLTERQIEEMIMPHIEQLRSDRTNMLSVGKMRVFLRDRDVILSTWKTRQIKDSIEASHPEIFDEDRASSEQPMDD